MLTPKVSICIPAYKQVEYLQRTLQSIQLQKFQNYEIIVTDDSPGDSVESLLKTFNFQGKLKYFRNKKSLGSPENWNEAVRHATAEYVKIMHHDDWFLKEDSLERFVKLLDEDNSADFGFSATLAWQVDVDRRLIHQATDKQIRNLFENPLCLFFGNFVGLNFG